MSRNRRRASLQGDEFMRRGRRHAVPIKRLLKDILREDKKAAVKAAKWEILDRINENGRVLRRVYRPFGEAGQKMIDGDRLTQILGEGWVSQGVWDLRRRDDKPGEIVLSRDFTEQERQDMGEIRDARYNLVRTYELLAHDIAAGRFFEDVAANEAWFQKKKPEGATVVDGSDVTRFYSTVAGVDWVKVPESTIPKSNTKRWGAIAGGYVRAAIWRDLAELHKMQNPGAWGWLLREWKANKTARSPSVHFNNVVGNVILSELYDFTAADLVRGLSEFSKAGPLYEEAASEGVFDSGFVRVELNRVDANNIVDDILKEVEAAEGGGQSNMERVWEIFKKFDRGMRNVYRWEDEVFRLVSYMRDRNMGATPEEAAKNARDRFMNYDIRAPWPNALRRSVLPFLSYTYAFVPQWLKAMSAKPWKIAKIFTIGYVFQALAFSIEPGEGEEEERRVMADRDLGLTWAGLPKTLRTPFTVGDDPIYMGMTRVLPGGGIADTDKGQIGLPEWMMISGPILTAGEVFLNRISFTGQDIVDQTDTEMEAAQKRLVHLWKSVIPNAPWIPGSWDQNRLISAASDETDMFGREYDLATAAIRMFGPKLYPHDVDSQRFYRQMEITRDTKEYQRKIWELNMDRQRNRIGDGAYERGIARVQDGLDVLRERADALYGR